MRSKNFPRCSSYVTAHPVRSAVISLSDDLPETVYHTAQQDGGSMNSRKVGCLLCAVLLLTALQATAQENQWVGRWRGSDANRLYDAEAAVTITEPLPQSGVLVWRGTVVIAPRQEGEAGTAFKLRGEQIGNSASGTLRGESSRINFVGQPVSRGLEITFRSGTYGKFKLLLRRVADIGGSWAFADGNIMTIRKRPNGDYIGTYRGTAASGHPDLVGTLTGKLSRFITGTASEWEGDFTIRELSVVVTGTFAFDYYPPTENSPATLVGHLISSTGTNPITLTKTGG